MHTTEIDDSERSGNVHSNQYMAMSSALQQVRDSGTNRTVYPCTGGWVVNMGTQHLQPGEFRLFTTGYPDNWVWKAEDTSAFYVKCAAVDLLAVDTFLKANAHTSMCELKLAVWKARAKLVFTSKAHFEADDLFFQLKLGVYQQD